VLLCHQFFKLKTVANITTSAAGDASFTVADDPTRSTDWTNVSNLFLWARVNAMKGKFIPTVTADTSFNYVPGFIFHVSTRSSAPSGLTVAVAAIYDSCRIKNLARSWSYYRKMIRDIDPTVKSTNRGYMLVVTIVRTQLFCCVSNFPTGLASKTVGYIMITRYVTAFGRA
jgi:hypothetical protein